MKLNELLGSVIIQGPFTVCVYDESYTSEEMPMGYENLRLLFETYDLCTERHMIDGATAEMEISCIYPLSYADHNRLMIEVKEAD